MRLLALLHNCDYDDYSVDCSNAFVDSQGLLKFVTDGKPNSQFSKKKAE